MKVPEIDDNQFGRMHWDERQEWCCAEVEWAPGLRIGLCIRIRGADTKQAIEHARGMFNSLRDRKDGYLSLAARKLLDAYNEYLEGEDERPVDARYFVGFVTLMAIQIDTEGDSTLDYSTHGGPLLVVTVSPDLSFKDAWFD